MIGDRVLRVYSQIANGEPFGIVRLLERAGRNGRSPRLIVEIKQGPNSTTWMPEHDDLFMMLRFYRENDREFGKLAAKVIQTIDGHDPVWDPSRYEGVLYE